LPELELLVGPRDVRSKFGAPIRVDLSSFKPEPHKNKYGKDYKPPPADEDERY